MPNTNEQKVGTSSGQTTNLDSLVQSTKPSDIPPPPSPQEPAEPLDALVTDTVVAVEPETVISRINAETDEGMASSEINLDKFIIPEATVNESTISLGESGVFSPDDKWFKFNYRRILSIAIVAICVFGIAALLLSIYNRYLSIAAQPIVPADKIEHIQDYLTLQGNLQTTLGISDYNKYTSLAIDIENGKKNIDDILHARFNYVTKKTLLQRAIDNFSSNLIGDKEELERVRQDVTKYGFFSQELYDLLQNEEYVTSIKESLLSLEMIKFSSAMKVFSYLDSFIGAIGNILNVSILEAQQKMNFFANRGEKDIALYINSCYLNPYEIDYTCTSVGDFDKYYTLIAKENTSFDVPFFKKIMELIDIRLEQTALPSFAITFQEFDPTQKQISFRVDVNTYQQDEAALMSKWVINPHIFVVTNLLNLIKQSLYVVSESVDAKSLKIVPKSIKVGTTVFSINNSTLNFILPIQQSTQREISDYTTKSIIIPTTGDTPTLQTTTTGDISNIPITGELPTLQTTTGDVLPITQ